MGLSLIQAEPLKNTGTPEQKCRTKRSFKYFTPYTHVFYLIPYAAKTSRTIFQVFCPEKVGAVRNRSKVHSGSTLVPTSFPPSASRLSSETARFSHLSRRSSVETVSNTCLKAEESEWHAALVGITKEPKSGFQ